MKKSFKTLLLIVSITLALFGCNKTQDKDIVILYTSDVHCGIDDNIGYASLNTYKKQLEKDNYVTLVDAGDAISGDFLGAISKGEYIIDIMNKLDYKFMVFGNHEFDFGMDALKDRVNQFEGDFLSCNFKYTGQKENKFNKVKSYEVVSYGHTKVGFVGVTTPQSLTDAKPSYFQEDGEYAYTFTNESATQFYTCVQDNINLCYEKKADYVVLITHLGDGEEYRPFSSVDLINNINGVNAVLDGHAHKDINKAIKDKDGKDIPLLDVGYKMNQVGKLTISKGNLKAELVNGINEKDPEMITFINGINEKVEELASQVMATSDISLSIIDEKGTRMTRNRETPIGNLVSDAYRVVGEAQIGLANGGGIRADLKKGDLTFRDIMALHPFGNTMDVIETTGQQIADYLEFGAQRTESEYYVINDDDSRSPKGEHGSFANVSGLKYSIDTSIPSTIQVDENGLFVGVTGTRRVKDIVILENNEYVPLDLTKKYTVCSHNYLLEEGGDGASMFKDCTILRKDIMFDYEILVRYIVDVLKGQLQDKYSSVEGRITIL